MAQRAAIYTRISRDFEGERVGVSRQQADCEALAERLGLNVVRVYSDNDTGASDRTRRSKVRHEYKAMLEAVEVGEFTHILSYSNSRLTRRFMELEDLINLHEKTGVKIVTVVSGQDDLSTADGRMIARIKASVDAAEADRISERMKASLRHKAQSGEPRVTSHRPFGWQQDGKTLDPVESALIREAIDDLLNGIPLNLIRRRWEEKGIKTPTGGTRWAWSNVYQILTSWRLVGVRTYNREVLYNEDKTPVKGNWETIITMEEREVVLRQIESRKLVRKRSGKYLLSGLLRCAECGNGMWGNARDGKNKTTQYTCAGSGHVSIDAGKLEAFVLTELYTHLLNRQLKGSKKVPEAKQAVWDGEEKLSDVQGQITELLSAFKTKLMSGEVVFPMIQQLERERDDLRQERDEFNAKQAQSPRELKTGEDIAKRLRELDSMEWEKRQALVKQETDAILIKKGIRGVMARDPEVFRKRVEIVWRKF